MNIDRTTLNLAAPALSTLGSLIALGAALRARPRGAGAIISALLGLVGSASWLASACQESMDPDESSVTA